jgi:hypothetical protein
MLALQPHETVVMLRLNGDTLWKGFWTECSEIIKDHYYFKGDAQFPLGKNKLFS